MNRKNLLLGILALSCLTVSNSWATDDAVYVNLGVLDGLSSSALVGNVHPQQPLFPIVKKSPKIKVKKVSKKVALPKSENRKEIKAVVTTESKTSLVSQPTVSEASNKIADQNTKKTNKAIEQKPQIPYIENEEQVVVVDVEPVSAPKADPIVTENTPTTSEQSFQPVPSIVDNKTTEEAPKLLVDENKTFDKPVLTHKLVFAPEEDELSSNQQKQIDEIIASFTNAAQNKIAIYSYNLDNGVDTFKKKRLSLNRAVAVRSYLLPKGYKNFSIKVVNVDAGSDKGNSVEIEELKN